MANTELQRLIASAKSYEALQVPALFAQWTSLLLDAVGTQTGERVLDVACGTGVLARAAAKRVTQAGTVAGIDPARGMLAVAKELTPAIDWREGTAESLPFPDHAFDKVVCQFGLMFFRDRAQALQQMRRVLVPDGTLGVAVWDRLENTTAYPVVVDMLERHAGRAAAKALRAPFVCGDTDALQALLEANGFGEVHITTHHGTARFPSIRTMVEADLRGWLPLMGVALEDALIERIVREAQSALSAYVDRYGQMVFDLPAHIATGSRS